ncbi:uncharacterized protein [Blastocystis hominis]|uniref:J domain-containing protein n=1 Tax=Blastocystis hominis TaxID=12968 RepID=D8M4M2_BLAHO|nr:uncharacterized protein [Blastocystis hominis]CBK23011.2 unnamed protein product [Blastocystis hominis]|eukprot:XP_012897059.1 uncharacterized protein [Blastocystis hominis]
MDDYYAILGVQRSDNVDTIKKAYRKLALTCHPDKGYSTEKFQLVNKAWDVLSDPVKRANYDKQYFADVDVVAQEIFPFSEFDYRSDDACYTHYCRCGGKFEIYEEEVAEKIEYVQCSECSLVCQIVYSS